jgi:hypothetical protein
MFRRDALGSFAILLPSLSLAVVALPAVKQYLRQSGREKAQRDDFAFWFAVVFTGLGAGLIVLSTILRARRRSGLLQG